MKKHKKLTRALALALAALLLLGVVAVPLTAFAAESQTVTGGGDMALDGIVGSGNIAVLTIADSSGAPLIGVTVTRSGGGNGTRKTTDEKGRVVFDGLTVGQDYTLSVSGFNTLSPSFFQLDTAGILRAAIKATNTGGSGDGGGGGGTKPKPTPTPLPTVTPAPTPGVTQTPAPSSAPSAGTETSTPLPSSGPETAPPVPSAGTETSRSTPKPTGSQQRPASSAAPTRPPEEPEATPPDITGGPGADKPNIPDVIQPPDSPVKVEVSEDKVLLLPEEIESSAVGNRDLQVEFVDEEGNVVETVTIAAFDAHDAELVKDSEVWVERRENDRPVIQLIKELDVITVEANIPHNIIQAARDRHADIQVIAKQPGSSLKGAVMTFPAGFFNSSVYDDQDTAVEYITGGEQWLVISNQAGVHASPSLTVTRELYEKAAEDGWGIKTRVYNPKDIEDLWYEWVFAPDDLKTVAEQFVDTDLFISPDRPDGVPLLDQLNERKNYLQYMSVNYEGQLPAPAQLRIKNMADFREGDEVVLLYCNEQAGALQTILTGLTVGEDGFIVYGMEHCSIYVLSAPRPDAPPVWWALVIAGIVCGIFLFVIFRRKKKMDELAWIVLGTLLEQRHETGGYGTVQETTLLSRVTAAAEEKRLSAPAKEILKRAELLKHNQYAGRYKTSAAFARGVKPTALWSATAKGGQAYAAHRKPSPDTTAVSHGQDQ